MVDECRVGAKYSGLGSVKLSLCWTIPLNSDVFWGSVVDPSTTDTVHTILHTLVVSLGVKY